MPVREEATPRQNLYEQILGLKEQTKTLEVCAACVACIPAAFIPAPLALRISRPEMLPVLLTCNRWPWGRWSSTRRGLGRQTKMPRKHCTSSRLRTSGACSRRSKGSAIKPARQYWCVDEAAPRMRVPLNAGVRS